jgi:NADH:ubiquinone oxidoreductase subunit F (NADH-binding)
MVVVGRAAMAESTSRIPAPVGLPRLLPHDPDATLGAHLRRLGPRPRGTSDLVLEIERSALHGRGGAGFPTAVKLSAVAHGRNPIVVANGAEGEPASGKDKTLLMLAPHLVLDGAVIAAEAVGATEVIVAVDRAAPAVVTAVDRAIAERAAVGGDAVTLRLAAAPDRYVAGEESALVHWLNGGDAKPTFTPPRPYEKGVGGRPTLVQNVETLAHVALIARFGADWFRTMGPPSEPGSALVTVSGAVARPGVYEVALGTSLPAIVGGAGGAAGEVTALLVGGYFGTWIAGDVAASLTLDRASLGASAASVGCGAIAVLPTRVCGLAETARVARWLARETAGQCGVCVNGLAAIAGALDVLVHGDGDGRAEAMLHRWLGMVKGRGACKHPDGAVRMIESAMHTFAGEIYRHRRSGPCLQSAATLLPLPRREGWR